MRLVCDPLFSEVDLRAPAAELSRLAGAVAEGEGLLSSAASPGSNALAGVEVKKTSGPGVLIRLDRERQILVISGDSAGRAVLADNLLEHRLPEPLLLPLGRGPQQLHALLGEDLLEERGREAVVRIRRVPARNFGSARLEFGGGRGVADRGAAVQHRMS